MPRKKSRSDLVVLSRNAPATQERTALPLGEQQRAGFGPTLAMQAVQVNLGMGVNAYAVVDFTALIKVVDDIGGIDVDVDIGEEGEAVGIGGKIDGAEP